MRRRADRGGCCGGKTTRCCLSRCTSRPSPHPPSPQQVIALLRSATTRFALFPCAWPGAQIECPFPAPPWLVVLTAMAVAFNHRLPAWSPARRPHDCWLARRSSHPIPLPTPSLPHPSPLIAPQPRAIMDRPASVRRLGLLRKRHRAPLRDLQNHADDASEEEMSAALLDFVSIAEAVGTLFVDGEISQSDMPFEKVKLGVSVGELSQSCHSFFSCRC